MLDLPGEAAAGLVVLYLILNALRNRSGRGFIWMMVKGIFMVYLLLVPSFVLIVIAGKTRFLEHFPIVGYLGCILCGTWLALKLIDWRFQEENE